MSHQVLARKWRPREFAALVGQDHVVRALGHALDSGRLHHAYLFTGTRGVGKTTIARILAKCLNCETGVTSRPCGVCRACVEIDGGRFIDYLEVDAASNRGVDEMTQLLENAAYAPTAGRYKVYVIDEVHMLSAHAFNAMLKTLEEPPAHVMFVLATTDPQRVPVTVLSRCLQFSLRNMPAPAIASHLADVLGREAIEFEPPALAAIGRAAAGSMRDALSLLDQAIAYGAGRVGEQAVREMLGSVDARHLGRLVDALVAGDGAALVAAGDEMLAANVPFDRALADLAAYLQRVALAAHGISPGEDEPHAAEIAAHAGVIAAEDLQVYYQIVIHGARDLPLAPDPHAGFTMTLLRLLAFRPSAADPAGVAGTRRDGTAEPANLPAAPMRTGAAPPARAATASPPMTSSVAPAGRPAPPTSFRSAAAAAPAQPSSTPRPPPSRPPSPQASSAAAPAATSPSARTFDGDWPALARVLPVTGFGLQFMQQSELLDHDGLSFRVRVPIKALADAPTVGKVRDVLSAWFGAPCRLAAEVGSVGGSTAAAAVSAERANRVAQARESIEADPFVQELLTDFGGRIVPDSVRPSE